MPHSLVFGEDLPADPRYPFVEHVPLERLRLDPGNLPPQRRRPDGTPVCLAGDHPVEGGARLCAACRRTITNAGQQRRRRARRPDVLISKSALTRVHEGVDALAPLMLQLTTAYNTGGNLRDEVNRIMLAFKDLNHEINDLLPDPRQDLDG